MKPRFQTGSNNPLANRNASRFCTASLPRKWSIRNTCDSSSTECTIALSSRADRRSDPNGFSSTTRAASVMSASPRPWAIAAKALGGTAAKYSLLKLSRVLIDASTAARNPSVPPGAKRPPT